MPSLRAVSFVLSLSLLVLLPTGAGLAGEGAAKPAPPPASMNGVWRFAKMGDIDVEAHLKKQLGPDSLLARMVWTIEGHELTIESRFASRVGKDGIEVCVAKATIGVQASPTALVVPANVAVKAQYKRLKVRKESKKKRKGVSERTVDTDTDTCNTSVSKGTFQLIRRTPTSMVIRYLDTEQQQDLVLVPALAEEDYESLL